MRYPSNLLNLLIRHDAFRVCRIMPERDFIKYCGERGVKVDKERLRQFERIGVFKPMIRAFGPEITFKIRNVNGGFSYAGELKPGEKWNGETRVETAWFDSTTRAAKYWQKKGLLWVPGQGPWEHEPTIDVLPDQHEAYYSQFQLYPLATVVSAMTFPVQLEWATLRDGSLNPKFSPKLRAQSARLGNRVAASLKGPRNDDIIAVLLQLLANRFFYKTQTDGRQITIGQHHDWKWEGYVRGWTPHAVKRALRLTEPDSRRHFEALDIAWQNVDPTARWQNLTRFIRVEKRKRLKGDALRGLALRDMAQMLRLFHEEAFSTTVRRLGEVGHEIFKRIPDVEPEVDPMRSLELVANDFGVNAKPQLVLIVEGATEQAIIPLLFERLWGLPASRYGIEIVNIGGVDNAAGGKAAPYSALWLLVDYLHHHQTLAFVLLDNEGLARKNVGERLPKAVSVHSGARRATRTDHIKIWNTSFEFENFSDTELAAAMNSHAGTGAFSTSDIRISREAVRAGPIKNQKLQTLDRLYLDRMNETLDKPRLGGILADMLCAEDARRRPANRPVVQFLMRIARRASLNFQPVTQADWERNQRSGYLGALQPEAQRERKRALDKKRRKRMRAIAKANGTP